MKPIIVMTTCVMQAVALSVVALCASVAGAASEEALQVRGPWTGNFGSCMGSACCVDVRRSAGAPACVRKEVIPVARPTAGNPDELLGEPEDFRLVSGPWNKSVHKIESPYLVGLASKDNKIVLPPEHKRILPISATHAVSDVGLVSFKSGKVIRPWDESLRLPIVFAPYDVTLEKTYARADGSTASYPVAQRSLAAVISVVAERPMPAPAKGLLCDVVFLNGHGEPRGRLDNVGCTKGVDAKRLGQRIMLRTHNPGEPSRLVFTNFLGEFIASSAQVDFFRPVLRFFYNDLHKGVANAGVETGNPEVALRIGTFPDPFDEGRDGLYQPLDGNGDPMEMGENVLGMMPVRIGRQNFPADYFQNGWILIEQAESGELRFRAGSGSAANVLRKRSSLPLLDRLQTAPKLTTGVAQLHGGLPGWHEETQLLVRLADTQQWVALDRNKPDVDVAYLQRLWSGRPANAAAVCSGGKWTLAPKSTQASHANEPHVCVGMSPEVLLAERRRHYDAAGELVADLLVRKQYHQDNQHIYIRQAAEQRARDKAAVDQSQARQTAARRNYTWGDVEYTICPVLGENSPECRAGRQRHPVEPPPPPPTIQQLLNENMRQYMVCQEARKNAARVVRNKGTYSVSGYVWVDIPECRNW
ncbi:MAG: hypothetical protein Q8J78_15515 [Moraxellaceae bacterium]|nr:hypothetical protein [Moraxellaceae bacterium]